MASVARVLLIGSGNLGGALRSKLQERGGIEVRLASRSSEDIKLDISSRESVLGLDTRFEPSSVDHVVVCTGASIFGPLSSFNADTWNSNVAGKLMAVSQLVLCLVQELKLLKDQGSVTITSGQAASVVNRTWPGLAVNCAGLNAFVMNAGVDLPRGIRLNACSPALVTETAQKAGLPVDSTVSAAECAEVYMDLMFGTQTGVVKAAGAQSAFQRKDDGLSKTSDMGNDST